jgi:Domain of unknown function (DUF222)
MFEPATPNATATPADPPSIGALAEAIDDLLADDPVSWTDDELAAAMVHLRRQQARLAAATLAATAAFDARRVWADDGSRNATDWISTRGRLPRAEVRADVRLGRRLRAMPLTCEALRSGAIGVAHAHRLAALTGHPRTATHFREGEPLLVANAATMRFDDFVRTCDHWRDAADPDGPERQAARDRDLRRVDRATGLDGVGHLSGYLTPLGYAAFGEALDRLEQEMFAADWAAARSEHGDAATTDHLRRTAPQRRHDALIEMAVRAMAAPADGKRPRPLVTVMVGYETFAGRVCQLAGGSVIAPGTVAELLGDDGTLVERVVFAEPNRITDISSARSFRGTLRRVLEVKHPRCTHPTCDVPARRCQGDHVVAWSDGGLTTQQNGQLLCGRHNRWSYHHPDERSTPAAAASGRARWWFESDAEAEVLRRWSNRRSRAPGLDLGATTAWRPVRIAAPSWCGPGRGPIIGT